MVPLLFPEEIRIMSRSVDPTIDIVSRTLKAAFQIYAPNVELRRRRNKGGYNISIGYSLKEGLKYLDEEEVYQALADRLVRTTDGSQAKMSLEEVKAYFTVKHIMGIGGVRIVGERPDGMTQHRVSGWLKEDHGSRVVVFLDLPKDNYNPHAAAEALHPTAFFGFAETTNLQVPAELKGKLLTAEEAAALEPPKPERTRRRRRA
jgi:hypothetical protein